MSATMYVYTKKGEERAREIGLDERKDGTRAYYANEPLTDGSICEAWLAKRYVRKLEVENHEMEH